MPGAPPAAGIIFTFSSASLTPRGVSGWALAKAWSSTVAKSRFMTGTQYGGRRSYSASYRSRKAWPTGVALVVLVQARPSEDRVPHDRVDPRVLEGGAHVARRIPVELARAPCSRTRCRSRSRSARWPAAWRRAARRTCRPMSWAVWGIHSSATIWMPRCGAGPAEALDVGLADQRLLDERADRACSPSLAMQLGPEDRLVGHRALRQGERPLPQPLLGSRSCSAPGRGSAPRSPPSSGRCCR